MSAKINKLIMSGFRGATSQAEVAFDIPKAVTLIFGENGTGKSTIADAFDFVCNRSCGSLENYSLGEPPRRHVASLGCEPSNVERNRCAVVLGLSSTYRSLTSRVVALLQAPSH